MDARLEVWSRSGREVLDLEGSRFTIGKDATNEIALVGDAAVSRLHAVLESFASGWCITDMGSANGTFVNGDRIFGTARVRHGDEVRIGATRLVFINSDDVGRTVTEVDELCPTLTPRERDVLVALCQPLLDRDLFTEPASIRQIATELAVSEAAVKQHLGNLYTKFGVTEADANRRVRLANEALRRGAVSLADLRQGSDG